MSIKVVALSSPFEIPEVTGSMERKVGPQESAFAVEQIL